MNLSATTIRSLLFYAGLLGIAEQEVARIVLGIEPSSAMLAIFAGFVLGSPAAAVAEAVAGRTEVVGDDGDKGA